MTRIKTVMWKKRFQFRLRTALLLMTVAAVLLGAGSLLPRGLRQLTIAVLVILAGSTFLFLVLWWVDQIVARNDSPRSLPIGSMMLTSVSTIIIVLVLLPLPGGRGPVQLWAGDATAMFVFTLRAATNLVMFISPLVCGLIGKIRLDLGGPARFGWLITAIASYVVAWSVVWSQAFFPTV